MAAVLERPEDEKDLGAIPDSEHSIAPEPVPTALPQKEKTDVPPDGGYGWVCVACVALINAHTWGINSVSNAL
jgi:hypothetical protein